MYRIKRSTINPEHPEANDNITLLLANFRSINPIIIVVASLRLKITTWLIKIPIMNVTSHLSIASVVNDIINIIIPHKHTPVKPIRKNIPVIR